MKIRQHRGSLADSMETTKEIGESMEALLFEIQSQLRFDLTIEMIRVKPYGGVDKRTGWDTHIVTINGYGVYGFTDRIVLR